MKSFGEFFEKYIDVSKLPDSINNSIILNVSVDSVNRTMFISAQCPALVDRNDIFLTENLIRNGVLNLTGCYFSPRYDSTLFDTDYFPQLVLELKRRNASLNGTLNDSTVTMDGNRLVIELKHGGKELLDSKRFDINLSQLIKQEFGINLKVCYSGILNLDIEDPEYINHQKTLEEKVLRDIKKFVLS